MKLFELKEFPYVTIETKGKKLKFVFRDHQHSYSTWYEVVVKYDEKSKQFALIDIKP